jgi:hypothetical protein
MYFGIIVSLSAHHYGCVDSRVSKPVNEIVYRRRRPAVPEIFPLFWRVGQASLGSAVSHFGFRPWLARHSRRKKRQWHLPPRASAGGWTIGSSDNGPRLAGFIIPVVNPVNPQAPGG